ncbi:MAG: oligosaccharide flippase family protein [Kiritimatiellae bacterium]|jgi:O-antigen/teichoic acid export membrane protein|nr:oligosaccharide flippase family protein [Kiritimatiellia bacterium]
MNRRDHLERHSLLLMGATLVGHAANYLYHLISGRLLSPNEYGLLVALFGVINLILLPMSALGVSLTRSIATDLQARRGSGIRPLCRNWIRGMALVAVAWMLVSWVAVGTAQSLLDVNRLAPILIGALIIALQLFLTLTGSVLQGTQQFTGLAMRGVLLFGLRALLVGACLLLGFKAAGWALFAHLIGMLAALAWSGGILLRRLPSEENASPSPAAPILIQSLATMPILLAFSFLMTADVILVRKYFSTELSGYFAQSATIARMILWLPLPIAQVMFPKVVPNGNDTQLQRYTFRKAMAYPQFLIGSALVVLWIAAPLGLKWMYGIPTPSAAQISWLRGIALAMALLGPVYLLMQRELARGNLRGTLPLCFWALAYPIGVHFNHQRPEDLIRLLILLSLGALLSQVLTSRMNHQT